MYKLTSEDLTSLGYMGATSTTNWTKYFKTIEAAKEFAENDYNGSREIDWKTDSSHICSGDLGYVMYYIHKVKTED